MKRALRQFGNDLRDCCYYKEFINKDSKSNISNIQKNEKLWKKSNIIDIGQNIVSIDAEMLRSNNSEE